MSLRFILGRAGSGKTHYCLQQIRKQLLESPLGRPLIFLVPEQATFQMDRALLEDGGPAGFARAYVLSFRRLAWRILREVGGAAHPPISDLGKHMLIRSLLRELRSELRIFGCRESEEGLTNQLARALNELAAYDLYPTVAGVCRLLSERLGEHDPLVRKLHDVKLIGEKLQGALTGRFVDPETAMVRASKVAGKSAILSGATVWVDGFTGFTTTEYLLLESVMNTADEVNLALCLEPSLAGKEPRAGDLFLPTQRTYRSVHALARKHGLQVLDPIKLPSPAGRRFCRSPGLGFLERAIATDGEGTYHSRHAAWEQEKGADRGLTPEEPLTSDRRQGHPPDWSGVRVLAAPNREAEVAAVARRIKAVVRQRGWRWRQVAVMVRRLEPYADLIESIFADAGIPCFIDQKRPLVYHPLCRLAVSALEIVVQDWSYDALFSYLKTDLVLPDREQVDLLENYVLAHGIEGRRGWLDSEPWSYIRRSLGASEDESGAQVGYDLKEINHIRDLVCHQLGPFDRRLRKSAETTAKGIAAALFQLLVDLKIPSRLDEWTREAENKGDLVAAQEHRTVWNGVIDVLDELVAALGDQPISLSDFTAIFRSGVEALRQGLVPLALDQVLVGTAERSRHPEVKAIFVMGFNEGEFPAASNEDAVFTDAERSLLADTGVELEPASRERTLMEDFLTYIVLTRASDHVCISYAESDDGGRPLLPSPYIERLSVLLGKLPVEKVVPPGEQVPALDLLLDRRDAAGQLAVALRREFAGEKIDQRWWALYERMRCDRESRSLLEGLLPALLYDNRARPIRERTARALYGSPLRASVSQLELFAACPFRYFATYGLRLKPRPSRELTAAHFGVFLHAALSRLVRRWQESGVDWSKFTLQSAALLLDDITQELAQELENEILLSSGRGCFYLRCLRRRLWWAARMLAEHVRRGVFRPVAVEVCFGAGGWPELGLTTRRGEPVSLRGRIDRVDAATIGDRLYVRVIDYKSSAMRLSLEDVYYGLALQLPLYSTVVLEGTNGEQPVALAGMLYVPLLEPVVRERGPLGDSQLERRLYSSLCPQGLLLADEDVIWAMDSELGSAPPILPVRMRKGGGFYKNSPVLDEAGLETVMQYAQKLAARLAGEIKSGQTSIAPYRKSGTSACRYCDYRPVCGFDYTLQGNRYRDLPPVDVDAIIARMAEEAAD